MAKYETVLKGNLDVIISDVEKEINSSMSASCEEKSDYRIGNTRIVIRAYERYSFVGGNRVSLNVVFAECDGEIRATAISTGGSQAMFFKINTWGEDAFLESVVNVLEKYK